MRIFQVGDVVALRSGGPSMTVYAVHKDKNDLAASRQIACAWIKTDGEPTSGTFLEECLKLVEAMVNE